MLLATIALAAAASHPGPSMRIFGPDRQRDQIVYCRTEVTRDNDMTPITITYLSRDGACGILPPGYGPYIKGERSGLDRNPNRAESGSKP